MRYCLWVLIVGLGMAFSGRAQLTGALAAGGSAEATAAGGSTVAETGGVLDSVEGNPAGLAGVGGPVLESSGLGVLGSGQFANRVDADGELRGNAGAIGYGAFGLRLGHSAWRVAAAITPEDLIRVSWLYRDPPGTAGASYGVQNNRSELIAVRGAAAVARTLGEHWAAGGELGLVYNRNTLQAPFIFQQQPQLKGLKVLLDLKAAGFGWNGAAGVQWQPERRVRLGLAWKSATAVQSHGPVTGTASAQFAALGLTADPAFAYRGEVDVRLPQAASAGVDLSTSSKTRVRAEGDWTGWRGAFRSLPVKLAGGTNATINSVAGSSAIEDNVPLGWRNQGGVRLGVERAAGERWALRAGYGYQGDPVPSATLTPLTAAVLRNTVAAGLGWKSGRLAVDAAYQAALPAARSVGSSSLLAGEYDDSRVRVWTEGVTITTRLGF